MKVVNTLKNLPTIGQVILTYIWNVDNHLFTILLSGKYIGEKGNS